jgi:hypothetical protein
VELLSLLSRLTAHEDSAKQERKGRDDELPRDRAGESYRYALREHGGCVKGVHSLLLSLYRILPETV